MRFIDAAVDTADLEEYTRKMTGIVELPASRRNQSLQEMLRPRGLANTNGGGWLRALQQWSEGEGWIAGPGWSP